MTDFKKPTTPGMTQVRRWSWSPGGRPRPRYLDTEAVCKAPCPLKFDTAESFGSTGIGK
jgi:hypothetical protein